MSKLFYTHFTKVIIDYILSHNKSIPHRSDSKLHNLQDDQPITKLLSTTNGDYKFRMEFPDAMISDAIKKKAGYTQLDDTVADIYAEWGRKLKCPAVEDLAVQSLLDLWKVSKARRLESLMQKKQPDAGEGSSVAHNKYYDTDNDAKFYSSTSEKTEESVNETDDADESNMDLSNDNLHGDDDAARYGVSMHNNSTATRNSTYLSLTVTSSSLDFIQTLLDEIRTNELMDFMSHPLYTDA
ncbi:hypothetical protein Tco_1348614 [Tanacetum coccineum]